VERMKRMGPGPTPSSEPRPTQQSTRRSSSSTLATTPRVYVSLTCINIVTVAAVLHRVDKLLQLPIAAISAHIRTDDDPVSDYIFSNVQKS
jgi:hypothetical protein